MSKPIITLENISKQYRLGLVGTNTLRGDIERWWYRLRGKEDPTLKIGEENKLDSREGEYVWALRDINLEVQAGEVLGIIGKNGAGKSTLLKILSRVTGPTTGRIMAHGRIASLLEVGTGFHPELTGRENIYLNGAILGMTKTEIRSKFDEIVDFAGVAKYVDTPVKRYSSGMYVRLAFAVAAHLEPEILIVDEVLAVGDAEFQKKAIGKMQDISKGGGRTVLFVSHNMASVQKLCTRGLVLENGQIVFSGDVNQAIDNYLDQNKAYRGIATSNKVDKTKKLQITEVAFCNGEKEVCDRIKRNEVSYISIKINVLKDGISYNPSFEIWTSKGACVFGSKLFDYKPESLKDSFFQKGEYQYYVKLPLDLFKEGEYYISAAATIPTIELLDYFPYEVGFRVLDTSSPINIHSEGRNGVILPILNWELDE